MIIAAIIVVLIALFIVSGRHVYYCPCCNAYYDGLGRVSPFSIGNDFWGNKICKECKKLNETI
jgi:hypothetical protein